MYSIRKTYNAWSCTEYTIPIKSSYTYIHSTENIKTQERLIYHGYLQHTTDQYGTVIYSIGKINTSLLYKAQAIPIHRGFIHPRKDQHIPVIYSTGTTYSALLFIANGRPKFSIENNTIQHRTHQYITIIYSIVKTIAARLYSIANINKARL